MKIQSKSLELVYLFGDKLKLCIRAFVIKDNGNIGKYTLAVVNDEENNSAEMLIDYELEYKNDSLQMIYLFNNENLSVNTQNKLDGFEITINFEEAAIKIVSEKYNTNDSIPLDILELGGVI